MGNDQNLKFWFTFHKISEKLLTSDKMTCLYILVYLIMLIDLQQKKFTLMRSDYTLNICKYDDQFCGVFVKVTTITVEKTKTVHVS